MDFAEGGWFSAGSIDDQEGICIFKLDKDEILRNILAETIQEVIMEFSIRTHGDKAEMHVTEDGVTCTIKLGKSHEIVTKGEDENGLAERIAYSHRILFGQGASGKDYLKLIKKDLIERNKPKED